MARKKKTIEGIKYSNSSGEFTLENGKLFDSEGNRVKASDVSANSNPLKALNTNG